MAGQEQTRPHRRDGEPDDLPDAPDPGAATAQVGDTEVDDVLAEIDGVLETNSEEFVRSFVQKGGQ